MDVIVAGKGSPALECSELLLRAGFDTGRALAQDERCPVVLGDVPHLFSQALQIVEAGRHLLIAHPAALSAVQLASLLAARKPRQAVYIWSERRYHPAYRLVSNLVRSDDSAWRPRYLRQTTLCSERPAGATLRWRASEGLALALDLARREPVTLTASGSHNPWRGAPDFLSATLELDGIDAFVAVGLGEAYDQRQTMLASNDRRAYVDETDATTPVRLMDDESASPGPRLVSCPSPGPFELARLQCLAFLEATTSTARSQEEADLWLRVIGCWQAVETSLAADGARVEVKEPAGAALRVISGGALAGRGALPPLKIVS